VETKKGKKGKKGKKLGKFHIPDNDWSHEPTPERKMWERKIEVESGIYFPFPHFPFWRKLLSTFRFL
jgi:hypothetical protein